MPTQSCIGKKWLRSVIGLVFCVGELWVCPQRTDKPSHPGETSGSLTLHHPLLEKSTHCSTVPSAVYPLTQTHPAAPPAVDLQQVDPPLTEPKSDGALQTSPMGKMFLQ
ncbi:unnamed protein product [Arctogadus glacialis]